MSRANRPEPSKSPTLDREEDTWTYHDVPLPELEAARAQGTIVVAACGFSFFPQPVPRFHTIAGSTPAVPLVRCKVCADINHNHFGERPSYDDLGC